MTPEQIEIEQRNFEAYAVKSGMSVERGSRGLYVSLGTNQQFSGWLARAEQADKFNLNDTFISRFIQKICELPDRNSPEEEPGALVCSPEELRTAILATVEEFSELSWKGWIAVSERLPEKGVNVLATYKNQIGKSKVIRAYWIPSKYLESSSLNEGPDFGVYDEETDNYYDPEGWYEAIENYIDYSGIFISDYVITYWQPLPAGPGERP